ncbi:MoxR family ATPase [Fontisphaera persica]|uniref:AAA family ATPase n=1 Tax=Fontisphaera persica TaxID=2974023 RepID=UPI0024C0D19A|nr:MoxR family ATPase [Fontisphaera persica]WCJ59663.1 MoxR family ATPase [Fontisphaera persica]
MDDSTATALKTAAPAASSQTLSDNDVAAVDQMRELYQKIRAEIARVIIGQDAVIEKLLICILSRGHGLLMGVPGLAKTLMVHSIANVMSLQFSRIQFTPDLMPSDITGTDILQETDQPGRRAFEFVKGPIFANIILADEINRTPPKTQSALLEAMQEYKVTAAGHNYKLPLPFFVLATQNPIEQEGTYPLPEAQLDRFMFFITVKYPTVEEERRIARETTGSMTVNLNKLIDGAQVMAYQELVQRVPVPDHIYDTVVDVVRMSRPTEPNAPEWVKKYVTWGAGPRAVQYLVKGAKARAVLNGSYLVRMEDVEAVLHPVLTHRILTNFQAQSEGVTSEEIINRLWAEVQGAEQRG